MKPFVNLRIPVIFACAVALGITAGYLLAFYKADTVYLTASLPFAAIFFAVGLFLRKPQIMIFTTVALLLFIGGAFNGYSGLESFGVCETDATELYEISGTVVEKGEASYGEYIIIDGVTADKTAINGKVKAYLPQIYGEFCDVGYKVKFFTTLGYEGPFPYGKLNYGVQNNIKYTCTVYGDLKSEYGFSFFGTIRSRIRNALYDNLGKETAAVCYAMLVGDAQGIDGETLQSFRYGGVAHIFAVSGLHIGLVYAIASLLCKKAKANKYAATAICLGLILFYAGICGFTLSSVRAAIMCGVTAFTKLFHFKRDGLNALAIAVIFILSVSPLSLFSLGFQLSVCSVSGILLFSNKIKRLLCKIKSPASVAGAVGTSFGAQLGTLPVMMSGFGYISGAGLVLNIIIVPAISLLFMPLFVFTVLAACIPQLGIALTGAALPLEAVLSFLVSCGFEKALIKGFGAGIFALFYYAGIALLSDKFNMKFLPRAIASAAVVAVLAVFVVVQTYSPANGHKIIVNGCSGGGCVIIKSRQGSVLIVTENVTISRVIDALNENYSSDLKGVIMLGGEECVAAYDTEIGCENLYVCSLYIPVQPYKNTKVHYEKEFSLCGVDFGFYDGYNLFFECDGVSVAVAASRDIAAGKCDILISRYLNLNPQTNDFYCEAAHTVYFSLRDYIYNTFDYGAMIYYTDGGNYTYARPQKQ